MNSLPEELNNHIYDYIGIFSGIINKDYENYKRKIKYKNAICIQKMFRKWKKDKKQLEEALRYSCTLSNQRLLTKKTLINMLCWLYPKTLLLSYPQFLNSKEHLNLYLPELMTKYKVRCFLKNNIITSDIIYHAGW